MTDESNKEVHNTLNSIADLAVAATPIGTRLQTLVSTVCGALQVPAARLIIADEMPVAPKSWTAGTDEMMTQWLQEWNAPEGASNFNVQIMKDSQGNAHELMSIPLVIGDQRLGTLALATLKPNHLTDEKSSGLRNIVAQVGLVLLVIKGSLTATLTRNDNWFTEEFLAMLSHELRAPLHVILGWISILQHPATKPATWAHALKTIERSARAQSNIINELLDASFCFHHQPNLNKRSVSAHSMLQQVIATLLPVAEQNGISLNSDIRLTNAYVLADAERLRQAFWHLLSNAIKFTPRNGYIQLLAQRKGDQLEFTLVDSGIGITPDFMPYVFDAFRQESGLTTRKYGGLGLGLAIARHQIELHDGSIEVTSAGKHQGATVVVRIPLASPLPAECERQPESTNLAISKRAAAKKDLSGLRVLVVDNDTDSLEIVSTVLQNCNSEVQTAVNALEAQNLLKYWEPDVLISDIQMPGIDGYELIRQLHQGRPSLRRRVAAIALTAYARAEDRLKVLTSGFHTHLSKPVDPTELVAVVTSLGAQSRQAFSLS